MVFPALFGLNCSSVQCPTIRLDAPPPLPDGVYCEVPAGDYARNGVVYRIPRGALGGAAFVWFDILLEGQVFVTFFVAVRAGRDGRLHRQGLFSPLLECQTRIVVPLVIPEAAVLANQLVIGIERKTEPPARFCLLPPMLTDQEPPCLVDPVLPKGPLLDELGQSTLADWPTKTPSVAALVARLQAARQAAPSQRPPATFSPWGGWRERRVAATGFFHTHHDGRRWWLVDPEGYLFWSSGADCVHPSIDHETRFRTRLQHLDHALAWRPSPLGPYGQAYRRNPWHPITDEELNFLQINFMRAFGPADWYGAWMELAQAELRRIGFNTAGDWSDEYAASHGRVPYARALELFLRFDRTPMAVGSFPDPFHPGLAADAAAFAECLRETCDDPAMLGYFLHNEPAWQFGPGGVAAAMLRQWNPCRPLACRHLAAFLRRRYGPDPGLHQAWGMHVDLDGVAGFQLASDFTPEACRDLEDFSTIMMRRLATCLSAACRRVDSHHLNLGVRWWTFPPLWALRGMRSFDVISFNYYQPRVDTVPYGRDREPGALAQLRALKRPCLIGEYHFGALDGGLHSAGLCRVADQAERGKAFRYYVEQSAALPWCVGAHWFNLYDRNALYCPQGNENYNIGFLDLTHQPHAPLCDAARQTHERLYAVASGAEPPFAEEPRQLFPSR